MRLVLGIDTSNYKTSVALVTTEGRIVADERRFLSVGKGERGLRQQEALFQHVNALPELIGKAFSGISADDEVVMAAASDRPRPVEGSYMPVFNAGASAAGSIAAALGCPCCFFSHQEMHIESARHGNEAEGWDRFAAFHFSGGTTEALICSENGSRGIDIGIIGGTKDISYGQVIDRAGVALGMDFPAGAELDRIAISATCAAERILLPKIKTAEGRINLSGIETACLRALENASGRSERDALIRLLFDRIAESMRELILDALDSSGTDRALLAGGVASSAYIRKKLGSMDMKGAKLVFAETALSSDNAVGTALLGAKRYGA